MTFDPRTFREYVRARHREGCGTLQIRVDTALALCDYLDGLVPIPGPRVEVPDPQRLAAATRSAQARLALAVHFDTVGWTDTDALETAVRAEAAYWAGVAS